MSFTGQNPSFESVEVLDSNNQGLAVDPREKLVRAQFVAAEVSTPVFVGGGTNDLQIQANNFPTATSVTYTLTVASASVGETLEGPWVGPGFAIGETVSGDISGALGLVVAYNPTFNNANVYITPILGTFSPGETVSGGSSGTSGILNALLGPFDTYDWTDSESNSGTGLVLPSPTTLSFGIETYTLTPTGHSPGDTWTFDVDGTMRTYFQVDGADVTVSMGLGSEGGPILAVDWLNNATASGALATVVQTEDDSGVIGLNDFTVGDLSNTGQLPQPLPITYTITIDGVGSPDTFSWVDSISGVTTSNVPIVAATPIPLSYGVTILFASDTGHTLGSTWVRVINQGFMVLQGCSYSSYQASLGDSEGVYTGAAILVDVSGNSIQATAPVSVSGNISSTNQVRALVVAKPSGSVVLDVDASRLNDNSGNEVVAIDGVTLRDADGNAAFAWGGRVLFDKAGNTFMSFVETNARRIYSANGIEAMTISNGQVNVGTGGGTTLRSQDGLQVVRKLTYVSQVKTSAYTYSFATDAQVQYLDTTSGAFTVNLPTAQASNLDFQVTFKRARGSNQPTIAAASGQFIDETNPDVSLNDHQAVTLAVGLVNGVYGWYTLSSY